MRRFNSEEQFVRSAIPALQEQFFCSNRQYRRVAKEVGVGRSIADIVAVTSTCRPDFRPRAGLSTPESVLHASLRKGGPMTPDALRARCGIATDVRIAEMFERLIEWGLIKQHEGGSVAVRDEWISSLDVTAVEAKLTRWNDGLEQAMAYRRYADRSFVMIPEVAADAAVRARAAFEAAGVGLLVFDGSQILVAIEAGLRDNHDWHREFVCSRILPKRLRPIAGHANKPNDRHLTGLASATP
jgi:hypothetical protein